VGGRKMVLEPTSDPVIAKEEEKLRRIAIEFYKRHWEDVAKQVSVLELFGKGER